MTFESQFTSYTTPNVQIDEMGSEAQTFYQKSVRWPSFEANLFNLVCAAPRLIQLNEQVNTDNMHKNSQIFHMIPNRMFTGTKTYRAEHLRTREKCRTKQSIGEDF